MASVSKGTKQRAVIGASQAMFSSLGFFVREMLPLTKESADMTWNAAASAIKLNNTMLAYLDMLVEPPQAVKVDPQEKFDEAIQKIKKRSFDLAAIGLLIPFLLDKNAKQYLTDFATGLIGEEAIGYFKTGLIAATSVLTGIFTYKLIKQVGDSIEAVKRLSQVIGTLFGITEIASTDIANESDTLDKEKRKIEADKKAEKESLDKTKKETKSLKDDLKKEKKKYPKGLRGTVSKAFDFVFKIGPKVGKGLLKALPVVGTIATIGVLMYEVYDEAVNFFRDEEKEDQQEPEQEQKPAITTTQSSSQSQDVQEITKSVQEAAPTISLTAAEPSKEPISKEAPVENNGNAPIVSEESSEVSFGQQGQIDKKSFSKEINLESVISSLYKNSNSASIEITPEDILEAKNIQEKAGDPEAITPEQVARNRQLNNNIKLELEKKLNINPASFNSSGKEIAGQSLIEVSEDVGSKKKLNRLNMLIINNIDNKVVTAASAET